MEKENKYISLSDKDNKDILKCLLFAASSDSCLDSTEKTNKELLGLAIALSTLLNINDLTDTNFYISDCINYDNKSVVDKIVKNFKVNIK